MFYSEDVYSVCKHRERIIVVAMELISDVSMDEYFSRLDCEQDALWDSRV
jgi:hypothetical protein